MTALLPREDKAERTHAALVGVVITEPDAEILVAVEHGLATVPVTDDWHPVPGDAAS